ncbi:MAG: hypothetical protein ACRD82_06020 [Blastocatellia bacterium]
MERTSKTDQKNAETGSSNVFSLAMVAGFICFLLADDLPGGFTSVQGFFIGFFAVICLQFILVVLQSRHSRLTELGKMQVNVPADVSITQTENNEGLTIQIFVGRKQMAGGGSNNER